MPLDKASLRGCPLLLTDDALWLSPDFTLEQHQLKDTVVGAAHTLAPPGKQLLRMLQETTTYSALTHAALQYDLTSTALRELLGFLNNIGALQRKRSGPGKRTALGIHCLHLMLGIAYRPLSYRRMATVRLVGWAVLRATTPVILAAGVVAGFAVAAGLVPMNTALLLMGYCSILFHISIWVHEMVHVLVLKRGGVSAAVLQSNMHLGIIHRLPGPETEVRSSLAGPLAGTVICVLGANLAWILNQPLLGLCSIGLSCCHCLSLLPLYGDGISLQKALRKRKRT